jgi:hypothetical protein
VAMMVVLLSADRATPSLRATAAARLARLGVTSVDVLRDERTVGLVIEGWAFDPRLSTADVVAAVTAEASSTQTLLPLVHVAVSAAAATTGGERP